MHQPIKKQLYRVTDPVHTHAGGGRMVIEGVEIIYSDAKDFALLPVRDLHQRTDEMGFKTTLSSLKVFGGIRDFKAIGFRVVCEVDSMFIEKSNNN